MTISDLTQPAPEPTLGQLRDQFRDVNGIPETNRRLEWIKVGPIPVPIPNPPARQRALRIHDLHHLVTGYQTDLAGEFEISAWECSAGLANEPLAWIFCPSGTLGGMLRYPKRTVAAFARGRAARTLFGQDPAATDALTLSEATTWCRTTTDAPAPTIRDWLGAAKWAAVGIISVLLPPLSLVIGRTRPAPTALRHADA